MSVWKRLTNVAKGKVKVWSQGDGDRDPDVERELSELERHPSPTEGPREETERRRPPEQAARPRKPSRNPAEEPVPRTDLFPGDEEVEEREADGVKKSL